MHLESIAPFSHLHRSAAAQSSGADGPRRLFQRPFIQSLAFLIYEQRDLHDALRFWTGVGMAVAEQTDHWLAMSAREGASFVLGATKGKRSRFVGSAISCG